MSSARHPPSDESRAAAAGGPRENGRFRVLQVLALEVFDRLPPGLVTLVFIAVLATMVAFVAIGIALADPSVAGYCVLGAIATILVVLVAVYLELKREIKWSRHVPSNAILGKHLESLHDLLDGIRRTARDFLRGELDGGELDDRLIRANVFLPDYNDQHDCAIAWLKIQHERLRIHMSHQPEWELQFRPGQGATGRAFALETAQVAVRRSEQAGQWDAVYLLTEEQKAKIDPRLKWVVSMPLKHPATNAAMGVLNVDGLAQEFDESVLGRMAILLAGGVKEFEERIARTAKVQITVRTEGRK